MPKNTFTLIRSVSDILDRHRSVFQISPTNPDVGTYIARARETGVIHFVFHPPAGESVPLTALSSDAWNNALLQKSPEKDKACERIDHILEEANGAREDWEFRLLTNAQISSLQTKGFEELLHALRCVWLSLSDDAMCEKDPTWETNILMSVAMDVAKVIFPSMLYGAATVDNDESRLMLFVYVDEASSEDH